MHLQLPKNRAARLMLGIYGILPVLALVACQPQNTQNHTHQHSEPLKPLSLSKSLTFGRQSAVFRHLSQVWQITAIDDVPTNRYAHLDLTHLSEGKASIQIRKECTPISIVFFTQNITKGDIYVSSIERTLDECSDDFEDQLMSIVADTRRLERDPQDLNKLTLISYQHTLTLTALP